MSVCNLAGPGVCREPLQTGAWGTGSGLEALLALVSTVRLADMYC